MGAEAFRKRWEEVFSSLPGPIGYELHDLSIVVGDDVAFSHSLNRISGTLTTGQQTALWLRWTAGFRKINGTWLIVHHHKVFRGTSVEDVRSTLARTNIDHVIMGGGITLETRLEMVRAIFQASDTANVHMKDEASGSQGFLPFVQAVLRGLMD